MHTIKVTFQEIQYPEDKTLMVLDLPHIAIPSLNDLVIIRKERYEVMDREFAPSDIPKFPQIFLKLEKI